MDFTQDLSNFTVAGITELRNAAVRHLASLRASVENPETVSDDLLAEMEEAKEFIVRADEEIAQRTEKVNKLAAFEGIEELSVETAATESTTTTEVVEGEVVEGTDKAAVVASTVEPGTQVVSAEVSKGGEGMRRSVQVADVAGSTDPNEFPEEKTFTIRAAADLPTFTSGQELEWDELGKAFEARARTYGSGPRQVGGRGGRLQHGFALIERQFPEEQQLLDNDGEMSLYTKLTDLQKKAANEVTQHNALVAAAGWCAPSETVYSTVNPVTTEGLFNLPEVVARRGGIRHNQGIDWSKFFGGTYPALDTNVPGMTLLTEAQVIADTAKTCLEIDCPPFIDERLNVAALCLTGSLLQNRGYPEYVAEFTRGSLAAFQHLVNREIIDIVEDGSTAVALTLTEATTAPALSTLMTAVEFAATDIRYRLRSGNAPIEVTLPDWVRLVLRADYMRRNAAANDDLADAAINEMFARRNVRVQYVMDWQDAFSGVAGGFGALTAPTDIPNTTVKFLAYPAGTWLLARQDVIRLDTVYDSVNLQQNQVTQLFMEDGYLPMRMGPLSRVYSTPICANGVTASTAVIQDCAVTP